MCSCWYVYLACRITQFLENVSYMPKLWIWLPMLGNQNWVFLTFWVPWATIGHCWFRALWILWSRDIPIYESSWHCFRKYELQSCKCYQCVMIISKLFFSPPPPSSSSRHHSHPALPPPTNRQHCAILVHGGQRSGACGHLLAPQRAACRHQRLPHPTPLQQRLRGVPAVVGGWGYLPMRSEEWCW